MIPEPVPFAVFFEKPDTGNGNFNGTNAERDGFSTAKFRWMVTYRPGAWAFGGSYLIVNVFFNYLSI